MKRALSAVRAWWSGEAPTPSTGPSKFNIGDAVAVCARLGEGTLIAIPATTVIGVSLWKKGDSIATDRGPRRVARTGYWYSVEGGSAGEWFAEKTLRPIGPGEWLEEEREHYHGPFTVTSPPSAK